MNQQSLELAFKAEYGVRPPIVARAPGRIEFIGNHTDYNGGLVLGAAIDRGVWVGLEPNAGGVLEFMTRLHGGEPTLGDFHVAWFVVAGLAIGLISYAFMKLLNRKTGAAI